MFCLQIRVMKWSAKSEQNNSLLEPAVNKNILYNILYNSIIDNYILRIIYSSWLLSLTVRGVHFRFDRFYLLLLDIAHCISATTVETTVPGRSLIAEIEMPSSNLFPYYNNGGFLLLFVLRFITLQLMA